MKNRFLELLEIHIQDFTEYFIIKYFGKLEDIDYWWVADEVGGVLSVNDYFFNLRDMIDFVRHNYSKKMMFEYYDYALDYYMKKNHKKTDYLININNYKYVQKNK